MENFDHKDHDGENNEKIKLFYFNSMQGFDKYRYTMHGTNNARFLDLNVNIYSQRIAPNEAPFLKVKNSLLKLLSALFWRNYYKGK